MLQGRQQKPISPDQMFQRLLHQSYREAQCEDQSQKIKKQRFVLIQLIQEYDNSIQQKLIRNNQCDHLEMLRLQKLQEIDRLKMERRLIEQSVNDQLVRVSISQGEKAEKQGLIVELQQVRVVNQKLRLKISDLLAYVQKIQQSNSSLQNQRATIQLKMVNRLRVNSNQWRQRVDSLQKRHQTHENELRVKILQKQAQRLRQVRRQQDQMKRRNQERWQQFRKVALKPSNIVLNNSSINDIKPFISRGVGKGEFKSFRVI